jgi:2-polyprenyl-6-methoxyphenol hydroxylase-like FAD-dependent oxidoreductase
MTDNLDVLVVGAGPAGLTLACDLKRRGLNIRIIDASETGFPGSRAKGIQPRTQEVFNDLGVLDDLTARASNYPLLGAHVGPLTLPWVMHRVHKPSEDVPFPNTLLIPQSETDACLRRRLTELGVDVEYATRLTAFSDTGDGIEATVTSDGRDETLRARFMVGADGGASTVRTQAQIEFAGATDDSDKMIVADVHVDQLSRNRWHIWPRLGGRFMALCPLPGSDKFQLMFRLKPDEEPSLERDAINRLVRSVSNVRITDVSWASIFRPNVRLAARYRAGNVFLVGDAAHCHTPAGAQGLNTGVQDSYNLGWKLAQVIAGAADPLLDTYEAERRPVAARVLGLSSELYKNMASKPLAAAKRGDEERQLSLSYRGGPLAAHTDRPDRSVVAGDRAPDARYTDSAGHAGRVFDACRGPHFTLLAIGQASIAAAQALRWPDGGAALHKVAIPAAGAKTLTRIYNLDGPAQVLIRPDGYIAHVATDDWEGAVHKTLEAVAPATTAEAQR